MKLFGPRYPEEIAKRIPPGQRLVKTWPVLHFGPIPDFDEPTFPGCRIQVRPVGVFVMRDAKGMDEKVLCVPLRDPAWSHVQDLSDLLPTLLAEIEHFFAVYKDLDDEVTETDGFRDRETALTIIQEARERAAAQA